MATVGVVMQDRDSTMKYEINRTIAVIFRPGPGRVNVPIVHRGRTVVL
jgi:hypothetical protein